jgi:S-adenosylmethionine:diacylglycerol 3-amino-3-carboxypropyl transferase/ubiquinone/menaquinone biosynthesis C-methylase UbiE
MSYIYNMIDHLINQNYIYTQSWEDGNVDLSAYQLSTTTSVLMITTGGDNVLNYLANGVEHVTTVDMNCHQNHLLELKVAVVLTQDRDTAMSILGKSDYKLLVEHWGEISEKLSEPARTYWKSRLYKFKNFWLSGIVGIFAGIADMSIWFFGLTPVVTALNESKGINEQREIYFNNTGKFKKLFNFGSYAMDYLIPFIGVPLRQYQLHTDKTFIEHLFKRLLVWQDWSVNYFYGPYTSSSKGWSDSCCPMYLKPEYFDVTKNALAEPSKLRIVTSRMDTITSQIKFNRIVLLDHLDWMDDDMIVKEWERLAELATDDCLYCFRSFCMTQPFASLRHLDYVVSEKTFNEDDSPARYGDRVAMYNSIHVAKRPAGPMSKIHEPKYNLSFTDSLSIFANMMIQPFIGLGLNNRDFMNHYYKKQAKHYDAYRQNMLHGKKPLMYSIPWHNMAGKKVLLLAGGTGDLTDYFQSWIPSMTQVTISDISEPMIEVARERIKTNGWSNVNARIEDILDDDDFHVDEEGTYDLVLLTYSLTMIPDWSKTIHKALRYLRPGGRLAVTDFTVMPQQPTLSKVFWKSIFSRTHIHLNEDHIEMLKSMCDVEYLRFEEGGFPHVPYIKCPFYYGLFTKKL